MDFDLTKEHKDIQKAAREFALGEFRDVAREYDLNETYPANIVKKARELDLIGLFIGLSTPRSARRGRNVGPRERPPPWERTEHLLTRCDGRLVRPSL